MITTGENEAGLLAYEQVQAFASLRRKKLPLIYLSFDFLMLAAAAVLMLAGYLSFGAALAVVVILLGGYSWWNWRRLGARDTTNRALLARLHATYGDDLPWLEVERQLAQIRQIEAEQLPLPGDQR